MANRKHVAKLKEGAEAWNAWRAKRGEDIDLDGAEFFAMDLSGMDLSGASLRRAKFRNCIVHGTRFTDAILKKAKLHVVIGQGSDFRKADLLDSRLHAMTIRDGFFGGAELSGASLIAGNFHECDFTAARVGFTMFGGCSFRRCLGFDAIHHSGASSIGIDTFFQSDRFPDVFLRGAGVPEQFIEYAASLVGTAIEYYSCFISYSSNDYDFARRLYNDLQGKNIRTWFADEDLKIGDRFRSRIDESIRFHDKLVLILSANSVNSEWVEAEVESALEREAREKKDVLFPIAIDEEGFSSDKPWAAHIRRTRHIGDFRQWKSHDDYTRAFDRLVRDLKKAQPPIVMH